MREHPGLEFAPIVEFLNFTLNAISCVIYNLYDRKLVIVYKYLGYKSCLHIAITYED